MLAELRRFMDPATGAFDAVNLLPVHSLARKQAVDLFCSTKAKIVQDALSSEESMRLLGSIAKLSAEKS